MFLSKNLRYLRSQAKLSQQGLADILGLSRSQIASYENGLAEPNAANLIIIARNFNVLLHDLIEIDIEMRAREESLGWEHNKAMTLLYKAGTYDDNKKRIEDYSSKLKRFVDIHKDYKKDSKKLTKPSRQYLQDTEDIIDLTQKLLALNEELMNKLQFHEQVFLKTNLSN
jgi:transcriptional regulator with XRE-family HTH domain